MLLNEIQSAKEQSFQITFDTFTFDDNLEKFLPPTDGSSALQDYLVATHANHIKPVKVTVKDILKDSIPVLISYGIGGAATIVYISVSQKAAKGNTIDYWMNPISSVTLNFLVNGYFLNLVAAPLWDGFLDFLFKKSSKEVQDAVYRLQNLNPKTSAKIFRALKETLLFLTVLGPAFASAFPMYALDKKQSNDPEIIADVVLISTTLLQYKGTEALFYRAIPAIFYPFKAIHRRINSNAETAHRITKMIRALKNAHKEALAAAGNQILKLIQTKKEGELKDIYGLLLKENPDYLDTTKLLFALCKLAPLDQSSNTDKAVHAIKRIMATIFGRKTMQSIGLISAAVSMASILVVTKQEAGEYAESTDEAKNWSLGSVIFLISAALSFEVSWDMSGKLYNLADYAAHGIKNAWHESNGFLDFAKKAWQSKFNLASWYNLVQFPLSILQNPKSMLTSLGALYGISLWTPASTDFLNEQIFGPEVSKFLKPFTDTSVIEFNIFPVLIIFSAIQRYNMSLLGNQKHKEEIRLETFIQNQIDLIDKIDDIKFLALLNDIVTNFHLEEEVINSQLQAFFGNKTPSDIFGSEHKYAEKKFTDIIPRMIDKDLKKLSKVSKISAQIGFHKPPKKDALLEELEGVDYGTLKMKTRSLSTPVPVKYTAMK